MRAVGWVLAAVLIAVVSLTLTLFLCHAARGNTTEGDQP